MIETAVQVEYLQRTLDVSFSMLASLLEVCASRLTLWVEGKDYENPKFVRVSNLYEIIDIADRYGIPKGHFIDLLQEPISGKEEDISLLFIILSSTEGSPCSFPGFEDDLMGYLDFLERFKNSLNLETKIMDYITCPECKKLSLSKHFDGEQTYLYCKEPACSFDGLLGDGDLTKKLDIKQ